MTTAQPSKAPQEQPLAAIAIRQLAKQTGAARIAFNQIEVLVEMGYRVVVLAEKANSDMIKAHGATLIKFRRWPFKGSIRRSWFNRRVQSWCQRHHPDLLVSHGDVETTDVLYLHNCVHLTNQRIHDSALPKGHEVAAIHDHILQRGYFKRLVANSQMMAVELKSRYGISDDKLEVSYPSYDPEQFNRENAQHGRAAMRSSLGVGEDEYLIGLVTSGNFKKRNVAGFIKIATLLNSRLPGRCRFLVVGKDDATPYQLQVQKLGIDERFIWRSTLPDVEHLYGALDVLILPAHIEEFGCVVLEAMACGTPVVVSAWVGASELLQQRFPELVIDGYSPEIWAERIESVLSNDSETLGAQLADLATKYSHQSLCDNLKASFRNLNAP